MPCKKTRQRKRRFTRCVTWRISRFPGWRISGGFRCWLQTAKDLHLIWQPKFRPFLIVAFFPALFILLTSCGGLGVGLATYHQRNVSSESRFWGGYEPDGIYELAADVFIMKVLDGGMDKRLALVPPTDLQKFGGMEYGAPTTVLEYRKAPDRWPEILGIVDAGEQVRIAKLELRGAALWGRWLILFAEVISGPYAGKVVDICDLSKMTESIRGKGPDLIRPSRRLLLKVDK